MDAHQVLKFKTHHNKDDSGSDSHLDTVPIAPVCKTQIIERGDVENDGDDAVKKGKPGLVPIEPYCKLPIIARGKVGNDGNDAVKEEKCDPVSLYFNPSDSSAYVRNGSAMPIGIAMSATEQVREIYLKNIFMMPPNHELYCPSCKVCINKVLFCTTLPHPPSPSPPPPHDPAEGEKLPPRNLDPSRTEAPPAQVEAPVVCCTCFSYLIEKGRGLITGLVPRPAVTPVVGGGGGGDAQIGIPDLPTDQVLPAIASPTVIPITGERSNTNGWEILKSIVYGGLAELLASLSVVTSAASADATTLSIFALGIANLIGGLSVLGHNLKDLRASQPREEGSSETNAENDKYEQLLGKRENIFLHAFVAILSFIIFGSVPPIVYGFSFRESDDKDLKLAAVAAASLICITLLAIAKAHIQKPNSYVTYLKTVAFYVTSGVLASLLTYVAGAFFKRLVEQLGWFETKSNFGLSLPQMSVLKSARLRGSY